MFYKSLIPILGGLSNDEAIFIHNLIMWRLTRENDSTIYKTDEMLSKECNLGIRQVWLFKKKFLNAGLYFIGKKSYEKFKNATPYIFNDEALFSLEISSLTKKLKSKTNSTKSIRGVQQNVEDVFNKRLNIYNRTLNTTLNTTDTPISPQGDGNIIPFQKKGEEENPYIYYGNSKKPELPLPSPKKSLKNNRFDEWYAEYPRKDARGSAEKAWNKIKSEEIDEIVQKTKCYATLVKEKSTERQFIPLPASWLNSKRWMDEELKDFLPKPPQKTEEERKIALLKKIWLEEYGTMEGFKYGTL